MSARMLLPFSMGTYGPMDSNTRERPIDHPILDIGSSYACVKEPIMYWLVETYDDNFKIGFDNNDYYIEFLTEADLNWFKLRWL